MYEDVASHVMSGGRLTREQATWLWTEGTDEQRAMAQDALDRWDETEPQLQARFELLQSGDEAGTPLDMTALMSPPLAADMLAVYVVMPLRLG